jgi:predicted Zn-dependent protease with MMP-like domain
LSLAVSALTTPLPPGSMNVMKRMKLSTFGRIVARVMETLPDEFCPYLDNVVVDVERFPDRRTLRKAGLSDEEIEAGETIYGLFDPLELPSVWGDVAVDTHDLLHRLVIFKRPLEEDFPDRKQLLMEIRKTVIHELAHHFHWTDRDLEKFDDTDDPFGDDFLVELERELKEGEERGE